MTGSATTSTGLADQLARILTGLGLDCGPLTPLPGANTRTVLTDHIRIVTRTTTATSPVAGHMDRELTWARLLGRVAATSQPALDHVLAHDGLITTAWQYVPAQRPVTADDMFALGRTIRRIHDHAVIPDGHATVDQLAAARRRHTHLHDTRPDVADQLTGLLEHAARLIDHDGDGPPVASHGDIRPDNVLAAPDGLTLIDLTAAGPAARIHDIGSALHAAREAYPDTPSAGPAFLGGYGTHPHVRRSRLAQLAWVRGVRGACTRAYLGQDVTALLARLHADTPTAGTAGQRDRRT